MTWALAFDDPSEKKDLEDVLGELLKFGGDVKAIVALLARLGFFFSFSVGKELVANDDEIVIESVVAADVGVGST